MHFVWILIFNQKIIFKKDCILSRLEEHDCNNSADNIMADKDNFRFGHFIGKAWKIWKYFKQLLADNPA